MRIGPFNVSRGAAEPSGRPAQQRGASGTVNQRGWLVPDEYNRDLIWPQSLKVFDRMRRSDASVREAIFHIFAPILNATVQIDPASDDPLHLEQAECVRRAFFEWPVDPFEQTLRQILHYLTFGFQLFELPEQIVEDELTWDDPTTREQQSAAPRQFVAWRMWAHRKPATIWRWNVEDGELVSVQQRVWTDAGYAEPEIPAEQFVLFVNEKEGDDFTGISILRTAYKAWWSKEVVEKVMGAAIERHGVGLPVAYVPESVKNDDAQLDRIEQMLQGIRSGEFNYLLFPGPKGEATAGQGGGGFFFEIVTPNGGIPDFAGPLNYLRGEIKGNVLARFSELGHGSTGARATGDVQSEVWYDALHSVARYVAAVMRGPIKRLVDKNYAGVDAYPTFVFRDIEARSLTQFADFVAKTGAVGGLIFDKSLRQAIRQTGDLPDEDEAAEADPNADPAADPTKEPAQPDPAQPIEEDPTSKPPGQ